MADTSTTGQRTRNTLDSDDGHEREVRERYTRGAAAPEPALCCPTTGYDPELLKSLPAEIVERDYGCGDPSQYVQPGEVVVDLGSGSGKICYILAQKVGPIGQVIGIDMNDAMLNLSRKHLAAMAQKFGFCNVRFLKARIQDMELDLDKAEAWLRENSVNSLNGLHAFEAECDRLRGETPAIADDSVDVVVSNCVLNLVRPQDKQPLFAEIHRVLRSGGRAVISDVVCDEDPTPAIQNDPKLWSGCISGAFREDRFLEMFEQAGFYGVEILSRSPEPWQVIDGIEFRSVTVRAFKGKEGACLERNQAVIYRGPWKQVKDDDGHTLIRGQRMAVCDKTFRLMTDSTGPYAADVIAVPPNREIPLDQAVAFDCRGTTDRHPRQTKGQDYRETKLSNGSVCSGNGSCC